MLRIDKLTLGSHVTLDYGTLLEPAVFLGIEGEGDSREAKFLSPGLAGLGAYTWNAYRYKGHWAYGASADRLRLVSVDRDPFNASEEK